MDTLTWVMATNMLVWASLGVYAIFLAVRQRGLQRRIKHLETLADESR